MKGILEKRKIGWFVKSWEKKLYILSGSQLEVSKDDVSFKKYNLQGAIISRIRTEIDREFTFTIVCSNGKELYLSAESENVLNLWINALSSATNAVMSSKVGSIENDKLSLKSSQTIAAQSSDLAKPQVLNTCILPDAIEVEGPAETGSELRCRSYPNASILDALCVSWFRLSSQPSSHMDDISLSPDFKLIQGVASHTYTLGEEDIGKFLGCLCKPAVGPGLKWAVLSDIVIPLDKSLPTARLSLIPHEHNKYCDRRVRVCTAPGRYREGEKLQLQPRGGPSGALANYRSVWYRSAVVDTFFIGSNKTLSDKSDQDIQKRIDLTMVNFFPINPRPVSDLAPAPPDYAPSPSIAEIRARLAPRLEPAQAPPAGFAVYPLFKEDTGCMILCALIPKNISPPSIIRPRLRGRVQVLVDEVENVIETEGIIVTRPVGPIEAAPPKAREIWIEGDYKVGSKLRGEMYYFGGFEGESIVSWIAIKSDGETEEVRAPTVISNDIIKGGVIDVLDPRELQLTESLKGCLLKFRVVPVRSDGNFGHQETSRPTDEIQ